MKTQKWNRFLRTIAMLLVITLICPILLGAAPTQAQTESVTEVIAKEKADEEVKVEEIPLISSAEVPNFISREQIEELGHIARISDEESLNTLVYLNRDGTKTKYITRDPIKYTDASGKVRFIDLSLVEKAEAYETAANDILLSIAKDAAKGVSVAGGGMAVTLTAMPTNQDLSGNITTAPMVTTTESNGAVIYNDLFGEGIDARYTPLYNGVKEDIILEAYTGISSFDFMLRTGGMEVFEDENGYYIAKDKDSLEQLRLSKVVAYDAKIRMREGTLLVTPIKEGEIYLLTVSVDAEFLKSPDTTYPVAIDPSLTVSDTTHGSGAIYDTPVYSGMPNSNFGNYQYNCIGYVDSSYQTGRVAIKLQGLINDSSYTKLSASAIQKVLFYVRDSSGSSAKVVNIYALRSLNSWTEGSLTWNNTLGNISSDLQASASIGGNAWTSFDITALVKGWKNNNYSAASGFIMKGDNESVGTNFISTEYGSSSYWPYVSLTYSAIDGNGTSFETALTLTEAKTTSVTTTAAGETRYYTFTPSVTATYVIQSCNYSGDPYIWLYDSSRTSIGTDDDGGFNWNFWISKTLYAGRKYYIRVGHRNSNIGSYNFTVLRVANIKDTFYRFQNVNSAQYLDIHGPVEQKYVHQWTNSVGEQQKWYLESIGDDYYVIRSQYGSRKYVGIKSTNNGESNIQLFDEISDYTKWTIYSTPSGQHILEPKAAKCKALYSPNGNTGVEMQLSWLGINGEKDKWVKLSCDYSGVKTFSTFDLGDSAEDESSLVKLKMEQLGYLDIGSFNSANEDISANKVKEIGRYSDVIYINGHGEYYANMRVQNSNGAVVGYVCADLSHTDSHTYNVPRATIGAQWLSGSTTKTNSYWNAGTKWGILAQCFQLNYGASIGAGNHWNNGTMNSAQMWARTMLGDGERVHGYIGYYNRAPGGATHADRLKDFFSYCYDYDKPIIIAWSQAHTRLVGSSDWAALYHSVNEEDKFQSMSNCTPSGSGYNIYYVARGITEEGLTLNSGGNTSSKSEQTVDRLINVYPMLVGGKRGNAAYSSQTNYSADAVHSMLQNRLNITEDSVLNVDDNGRIVYSSGKREWAKCAVKYELANEEAITMAEQYLASLGLAPDGDYRVTVSKIQRCKLNLESNHSNTPETVEYVVSFYRTVNGIDIISDQEDGILISFDKNGITELRYLWRNIEYTASQYVSTQNAISIDEAREIYQAELDKATQIIVGDDALTAETANATVAYLQIDNNVRPVYAFSSDAGYANCVIIDMISGEVLSIFK